MSRHFFIGSSQQNSFSVPFAGGMCFSFPGRALCPGGHLWAAQVFWQQTLSFGRVLFLASSFGTHLAVGQPSLFVFQNASQVSSQHSLSDPSELSFPGSFL